MKGIDVSHHNGSIHWDRVVKENTPKIDFVFLKATEGTSYTDSMLKLNAFGASQNNIPLSYYHFATLNTDNVQADAGAEASYFVSGIKNLPPASLPLVLDIETNKANLSSAQVLDWVNAFFKKLTELGYPNHILYSYTPFLNANLPTNHGLGNIPLWIAAYTTNLKLPQGWSKELIWQYSAKGVVNGINGNVDLNRTITPLF